MTDTSPDEMATRLAASQEEARQLRIRIDALEKQLIQDPLTEVNNRLALVREISKLIKRRKRSDSFDPATVVFVDVDQFKSINSKYTHAGGDAALKYVASKLQTHHTHFVGRLGGDEFMVIIYGATPETAADSIQNIKDAVAESPCEFTDENGKHHSFPVAVTATPRLITREDTVDTVIGGGSRHMLAGKPGARGAGRGN